MAFTNKTFSVGGTLAASDINNLQGNFAAVCSGDGFLTGLGALSTTVKSSGVWSMAANTYFIPSSCFAYFLLSARADATFHHIVYRLGANSWYQMGQVINAPGFLMFDGANIGFQNMGGAKQFRYLVF